MGKLNIKLGDKFNSLTVVKEVEHLTLPSGQTNRAFLCECDCGKEKIIRLAHLVRGKIKTCNTCQLYDVPEDQKRIYRVWRGMKDRCRPTHIAPHLYYYKGIKVCRQWQNFYVFRDFALANGYKDDLQIDRIDGNDIYKPSNCRFVTPIINANNTVNTVYVKYKGEVEPLMLLIRRKGLFNHSYTIRGRIKRGWDIDTAIDTPIRKGNYKTKTL